MMTTKRTGYPVIDEILESIAPTATTTTPCQRCTGIATTTVTTRHFGLEQLCEPCAVNVRRDGQEVTTTQPAPDTGEWLSQLQARIDSRDDDNAMNSACGEYNCPCHYDLPKLLYVTATVRDTLLLVQRLLVNQQSCEQSLCKSCNEARQTILDSVNATLITLRNGA